MKFLCFWLPDFIQGKLMVYFNRKFWKSWNCCFLFTKINSIFISWKPVLILSFHKIEKSKPIIILNVKCDLNQQRRFWPPFSSGFSIALPVFPILHRLDLTRIDVFLYLSISKLSKSGIPTWLGERSVLLVTRCKVYLLYIEHQKLRFLKTFFFLLNWFLPLTVSPLFISFKIHILFLTISPIIPAISTASLCTHSSLTRYRYRASHQRQNGHEGQSSIFRT